jgi:hypothetical protein
VGLFFIDTGTGQIATHRQLIDAGVAAADSLPPRPWHKVQGSVDASTMWFAVMRKQERGVYIGTLVLRHSDHHTLLGEQGWEEVPIEQIRVEQPGGTGTPSPPGAG